MYRSFRIIVNHPTILSIGFCKAKVNPKPIKPTEAIIVAKLFTKIKIEMTTHINKMIYRIKLLILAIRPALYPCFLYQEETNELMIHSNTLKSTNNKSRTNILGIKLTRPGLIINISKIEENASSLSITKRRIKERISKLLTNIIDFIFL